jgi:hypothetical protein
MARVLAAEREAKDALEASRREAARILHEARARAKAVAAAAARRTAAVRAAMARRLAARLAEIETQERAALDAGALAPGELERLDAAVARLAAELCGRDEAS